MLSRWLGTLGARSPRLRHALWRAGYEVLARRYGQADWTFMNYGYAALQPDDARPRLEAADEADRYPIQLYHHLAAAGELAGAAVLEVGCGRGGGCSYLARYFNPERVVGVDFSPQAIRFCRRVHTARGLSFVEGDAAALPFPDESFEVVVNVESSHCYPDPERFLREVFRVLRPGGRFLWADMRPVEQVDSTRRQFRNAGFRFLRERRITPNVLHALDRMSDGRAEMVRRLVPRMLVGPVGDFAGVRGSRVYESLRSGAVEYWSWVLGK